MPDDRLASLGVHRLLAIVRTSETAGSVEILWQGSAPDRDQMDKWVLQFPTRAEVDERNREFWRAIDEIRRNAPGTLLEAVARILADLSAEDRAQLASTPEDELAKYHFSWGRNIRNLWLHTNPALMADCGSNSYDDASMLIIWTVWQRIRNEG
jgi:hypothetical protein